MRRAERAIFRLLVRAGTHGAAIGIGHPYAATLALLERELPGLAARGITLVPLSALLQRGVP